MDHTKLSASDILGCTRPEFVFGTSSKELAEPVLKALQRRWHPDRNTEPKAHEVFCYLTELYNRLGSYLTYTHGGNIVTFKQRCETSFALGKVYHHESGVAIVLDANRVKFSDYFVENLKKVREIVDKEERFKDKIAPFVPHLHKVSDDKRTIVVRIPKGTVNLGLLLNSQPIPPRAAVWMVSRMLNHAVLMDYCGLVHNAFGLDSFWVNTVDHTGVDVLGYFFAVPHGEKLRSLPQESLECYPMKALAAKVADRTVDIRLIKKAGIRLMGDLTGTGMTLKASEDLPQSLIDWLRSPTMESKPKLDVYKEWMNDLLPKIFGERRFYKWEISPETVMKSEV